MKAPKLRRSHPQALLGKVEAPAGLGCMALAEWYFVEVLREQRARVRGDGRLGVENGVFYPAVRSFNRMAGSFSRGAGSFNQGAGSFNRGAGSFNRGAGSSSRAS